MKSEENKNLNRYVSLSGRNSAYFRNFVNSLLVPKNT